MTTLTLRSGKGSALTFAELDDNFSNLNTDLGTTTTALGDYLPLAGGSLTGDITTTGEINIADGNWVAWGGGTGRPLIMGNKADGNMKFYIAGAIRAQLEETSMTFNVADVAIENKLSHVGDTDNYLSFGANTLNLTQGGTSSLTATANDINVFKTLDLDPVDGTQSISSKVDLATGNQSLSSAFFDLNVSGNDAATADRSHIGIQVAVDTSYTGGDTSNEGRAYGVYAVTTSSGDNDIVVGGHFRANTNGTDANVSTNTTNVYGVFGQADQNRATLNSNQFGVYGVSTSDNGTDAATNQVTTAYGVYGLHNNGIGGTSGRVANAHGLSGEVQVDEGSVGNAYGVRSTIDHNGGEISVAYLYHGAYAVTGTPTTTKWGIRLIGSTVNAIAGTLRLSDGAVTAPTLCNDDDTNTGIYWPSDEVIGFSTGGIQRVNISSAGLDVTGAITVSGNVDGRDVAADGTKLDTISNNANVYVDADVDAYINASILTTDISEGTNLYYTDARVGTFLGTKSTSDLTEGTNLYYTDARADARIAAASIFALTDVASGTVVTNLNADKVDGFHGIGIYNAAGTLLNG